MSRSSNFTEAPFARNSLTKTVTFSEIARRDTFEKCTVQQDDLVSYVDRLLEEIQQNLYAKALSFREANITQVTTFDEFKDAIATKGGFVSAHWDGTIETEMKIKELTKATIRCIPNDAKEEQGKCVFSGAESNRKVLFAKAY